MHRTIQYSCCMCVRNLSIVPAERQIKYLMELSIHICAYPYGYIIGTTIGDHIHDKWSEIIPVEFNFIHLFFIK